MQIVRLRHERERRKFMMEIRCLIGIVNTCYNAVKAWPFLVVVHGEEHFQHAQKEEQQNYGTDSPEILVDDVAETLTSHLLWQRYILTYRAVDVLCSDTVCCSYFMQITLVAYFLLACLFTKHGMFCVAVSMSVCTGFVQLSLLSCMNYQSPLVTLVQDDVQAEMKKIVTSGMEASKLENWAQWSTKSVRIRSLSREAGCYQSLLRWARALSRVCFPWVC